MGTLCLTDSALTLVELSCKRQSGDEVDIVLKLSILMLTYNREKLVSRAIESVLAQTFTNFEYIIVDNGSTDASGSIADDYSEKDPRISVVHIERSSIGRGRNVALSRAAGDYVTFIDDDDIAEPDMMEFLFNLSVDHDADIAVCGSTKLVDGEKLPNCVFDECLVMNAADAVVELLRRKKYNAAMPTKMLKQTIFRRVGFEEGGKYDDITATYKYFAEAEKVVAWGKPKYCFARHTGNNSAFTTDDKLLTPEQLDEYFAAFRERTEYLKRKLPEIGDYALYSEWSYLISMCNKIIKNNLTGCGKQLRFVKRELTKNFGEFYNSPYIERLEVEYMDKYIKPYLEPGRDVF
jgi:glycosyltransferase involved in cell wall biosynthesis